MNWDSGFSPRLSVTLRVRLAAANARFLWPSLAQGYRLETTTNLADPGSWTAVPGQAAVMGLDNVVTHPLLPGHHFYRLRKP
jgi:hypothetical protein